MVFLFFSILCVTSIISCGALNPIGSLDYKPALLPVGPLTVSVWLPAGMNEFQFNSEHQSHLLRLGLNTVQWVQRYEDDNGTAEEQIMSFANDNGLQMPVYYEPPGWTAYDKLHNWSIRREVTQTDSLFRLVKQLRDRWVMNNAFAGYLVGHEDYENDYYRSLSEVLKVIHEIDPDRSAFSVGRIQDYQDREAFFSALFDGKGTSNIFQQEHYIFRGNLPKKGSKFQRRIDDLVEGYDVVARGMEGRSARWHAIVQVQSERRSGRYYYRKPTPSEIRLQVGLALTRGCAGIVYFLYSSGVEELLDSKEQIIETRIYEGIVDPDGFPTETYWAVKEINADLMQLERVLSGLHFHGGISSRKFLSNDHIISIEGMAEVGFYGDSLNVSHLLVANRRSDIAQRIKLLLRSSDADQISGTERRLLEIDLEPGAFTLVPFDERTY